MATNMSLQPFLEQQMKRGNIKTRSLPEAMKMWKSGLYRGRDGKIRKLGESGSIYRDQ